MAREGRIQPVNDDEGNRPRKHRLALVVAPTLFADALASVLAADDVDEVIDLTDLTEAAAGVDPLTHGRFDTAVISPGAVAPDADVVIVLPPSGCGEVVINRRGAADPERVDVPSVAALFDLLDVYDPADQRRRRP